LEIIAATDKLPKRIFTNIAEQFNIDRTTVSKIYMSRKSLVVNSDCSNSDRKRNRHSKEDNVGHALYEWFISISATNLPIGGEMLRLKAIKFAQDLGIDNFKASDGFLSR